MDNTGVPETARLLGNPVLSAIETAALAVIKNEVLLTPGSVLWRQPVHPNRITIAQDLTSLFPPWDKCKQPWKKQAQNPLMSRWF